MLDMLACAGGLRRLGVLGDVVVLVVLRFCGLRRLRAMERAGVGLTIV
jgi:hypothetical protein